MKLKKKEVSDGHVHTEVMTVRFQERNGCSMMVVGRFSHAFLPDCLHSRRRCRAGSDDVVHQRKTLRNSSTYHSTHRHRDASSRQNKKNGIPTEQIATNEDFLHSFLNDVFFGSSTVFFFVRPAVCLLFWFVIVRLFARVLFFFSWKTNKNRRFRSEVAEIDGPIAVVVSPTGKGKQRSG